MNPGDRPGLRHGVRLVHDPVRDRPALLYPEGVLLLNVPAAAILRACDGNRGVEDVLAVLATRYAGVRPVDVDRALDNLVARRLVSVDGTGHAPAPDAPAAQPRSVRPEPPPPAPLGLVAELTYRCPLHCTYCANPVNLSDYRRELSTVDWMSVLEQARELGVLQVHLTGGEPLARRDLTQIVTRASGLGMYTNLITSGIPLPRDRLAELARAGLDHVQLSVQDATAEGADAIAGRAAHERKATVAAMVRDTGLPLSINVVLHRANAANVAQLVELAVAWGAERLELAHTQFYGWALRNRAALLPTRDQVDAAAAAVSEARLRHGDQLEIVYVAADYYDTRPKPCMNGWGSRQLVVAPNGDVLPCLSAGQLPGRPAPTVTRMDLRSCWYDSELFNRFRGTDWMPQPCHDCALREVDFGGCRCQAYQLTGDSAATDPACELSPHHDLVASLAAPALAPQAVPRRMR